MVNKKTVKSPEGIWSKNLHFPMVFLWFSPFSYGFPYRSTTSGFDREPSPEKRPERAPFQGNGSPSRDRACVHGGHPISIDFLGFYVHY